MRRGGRRRGRPAVRGLAGELPLCLLGTLWEGGRCWHCCLLPNLQKTLWGRGERGRNAESLLFNYSAARASCRPCLSQRKSLARVPGWVWLGWCSSGSRRDRQPGPQRCWHHGLGLCHSAPGPSPALPYAALCWAQGSLCRAQRMSPSLQSQFVLRNRGAGAG